MRTIPSIARVLGICALGVSAACWAGDWPQWRGPRRDGICRETGWTAQWPEGGPPKLWQAEVGKGLATVAVADGRLYTLGRLDEQDDQGRRLKREVLWCLDAATGKAVWRHEHEGSGPGSYEGPAATPTVDDGRVFAHGRGGYLACLEAATGKLLWSRDLRQDFKLPTQRPDYGNSCSPLIVDGRLIVEVGGVKGNVVALDKASGKLLWQSVGTGQLSYSSPMPFEHDGAKRVAVFHSLGLGVLDPATGKELWRYPWKTFDRCSVATPVVVGERILVSAAYNKGAALLEVGREKPVWFSKELESHHATPVLWEGHLYGVHGGNRNPGHLRCLDAATGKLKWSQSGLGKGTLLVADGKLIVLSQQGELLVAPASPDGFKPISRAKILGGLCWTMPVLANGRLYCRNHPGTLVCLDLRRKP